MELLNEMYKAREAGAAGTPEWDEATEVLPQDAGARLPAPRRGALDCAAGQTVLGPPAELADRWIEAAAMEDVIEIPVQVNGKVRDRVTVPADASEEEIKAAALASEIVQQVHGGQGTPQDHRRPEAAGQRRRLILRDLLPRAERAIFVIARSAETRC